MTFSKNTRRPALTLIELLVAITIIGTLISLLMVAVQQVREAAMRTACQYNMRQLGVALESYRSRSGIWPKQIWTIELLDDLEQSALKTTSLSPEQMGQYVVKPYLCPGDQPIRLGPDQLVSANVSLNAYVIGQRYSVLQRGSSSVVLSTEGGARDVNTAWIRGPQATGLVLSQGPHRNGANVLFCDGHVSFLSLGTISPDNLDRLMRPDDASVIDCF